MAVGVGTDPPMYAPPPATKVVDLVVQRNKSA